MILFAAWHKVGQYSHIMSTLRTNDICIVVHLQLMLYAESVANLVATGFCANVSSVNRLWPLKVIGCCCITALCHELPPRRCYQGWECLSSACTRINIQLLLLHRIQIWYWVSTEERLQICFIYYLSLCFSDHPLVFLITFNCFLERDDS